MLNFVGVSGLPGTAGEGTACTVGAIRKACGRVRPPVYSSPERHPKAPDVPALSAFSRQLMHPEDVTDPENADAFHAFLFGHESWSTQVMDLIPSRGAQL